MNLNYWGANIPLLLKNNLGVYISYILSFFILNIIQILFKKNIVRDEIYGEYDGFKQLRMPLNFN